MAVAKLNIRAISSGIIAYLFFYILLVVVLSVLFNFASISMTSLFLLGPILVMSGCFGAGFITGRKAKVNGAMHGLTVGGAGAVIIIAILLLLAANIGLEGSVSASFPAMLVWVLLSCLICSAAGAFGSLTRGVNMLSLTHP